MLSEISLYFYDLFSVAVLLLILVKQPHGAFDISFFLTKWCLGDRALSY